MSHDRGCPCGKERWEYEECRRTNCYKRHLVARWKRERGESMQTVANEKQVGGAHYQSGYQHWDWCIDLGLGYLEAAATKYVTRWRDKNGVQDLEKARHYVEKISEAFADGRYDPRKQRKKDTFLTTQFIQKNGLELHEASICAGLATWDDQEMISDVLDSFDALIATAQGAASAPAPAGGTGTPAGGQAAALGQPSEQGRGFAVGGAVYTTHTIENRIPEELSGKRGIVEQLVTDSKSGEDAAVVRWETEDGPMHETIPLKFLLHYRDTKITKQE